MSVQIAPSILAADFGRLGEAVEIADRGGADLIHFDVMDGKFVPNLTFGPPLVKAVRNRSRLPFDVHLMIERPWDLIHDFVAAGANNLTIHAEACPDIHRTVQQILGLGATASVALNPHTPVEMVRHVLPDLFHLLIMTVSPGFGGQAYIEAMTEKIEEAASMVAAVNPQCRVQVDGGIDLATAPIAARAGATMFVAGSAICGSPNVADAIRDLRKAAEGALV
jgi:ribulose-phosphate 3-epimerase